MKFLESISSAFRSVYAYKMRSLLTMLGIIIGISSVIMITSLGDGVYNAIYDEMAGFNTTAIQVAPRNMWGGPIIDQGDIAAVTSLPNVEIVTGMIEIFGQEVSTRVPGETRRGILYGLDHNYHSVEIINMLYGRFITEQDVVNNAYVAVISPEVSLEIFGFVNSVGHTIEARGNATGRYVLTVIGVLDIEPGMVMAQSPVNMGLLFVPVSTAGIIRNNPGKIDFLSVAVENPDLSLATADQIVRLLNIRHDRDNAFLAISLTTVMEGMDIVFGAVTGFIAFVAGISLFVGGVGVMNIMMVTVTERTREIGIRKSLGATGNIIRLQFVFEAVMLTFIGGIIGIIFGLIGAGVLSMVITNISPMAVTAAVDVNAIIIAVVVSTMVGVVFGVYPASKAAKLDPVDSLRYE